MEDPNEQVYNYAKSQGDCPCRLWLILLLTNLTIIIVFTFLIILLLVEIGPARRLKENNCFFSLSTLIDLETDS